jgi:hypothetical protein
VTEPFGSPRRDTRPAPLTRRPSPEGYKANIATSRPQRRVPLRRGPPCFGCRVGRGQCLWLSLSAELYLNISRWLRRPTSALDRGREAADRGGEPEWVAAGFVDGETARYLLIAADDMTSAVPGAASPCW